MLNSIAKESWIKPIYALLFYLCDFLSFSEEILMEEGDE